MFVYKIEVNPIHTILEYGDYYDFKDKLNGAVFKSSSQWQLNEFSKLNNELFIFKILLVAIDWNFQELHHCLSTKS